MKQTLLLTFLLFFGIMIFAQGDRSFAFNTPNKTQINKGSDIDLTIYPNPFTSYIKINDEEDLVRHITIYNLLGKRLVRFPAAKGESYNVSDLPVGMYLVQLEGEKDKVLKTQRIQKR